MKRALALWLPQWPLQRLVVAQPELRPCAVVLYERQARGGEVVKFASVRAAQHGVRLGMPLAEALSLFPAESAGTADAQPCLIRHQPELDRQALSELAERCEEFSPHVGLDAGDEPDGLEMEIDGVAPLFGGEEPLAEQLAAFFQARGLLIRIGIADTPSAARAVARWGDVLPAPCPASIIPPGQVEWLDGLPVIALRLPSALAATLQRLGLERLGQLRRLPRDSLAARCGAELIHRLDQFYGAAAELIPAHRPAVEFSARQALEHPTAQHETLACLLDSLLRQLAAQLTAHGQGVLQLDCRFLCQESGARQISINLFQPTADPQHLGTLLRMQWEPIRLPGLVEEIQLTAPATASREQRQTSLFANALPGEAASLARLIERLSNRVGRDQVLRPQLQDEAQVELAYRCVPLTGPRPDDEPAFGRPLPGPWCRPLRLVDPPQPIDVLGIALDGPPALVRRAGRQHRVARAFGPERIETGWWRGPSSRRDYYRIETEDGQRWWLFRQIPDKKWFLHGTFD